ncbi:SDR family NAD(P)-dependent oxidoreductase [Prosthecomicrobium sp. N25]|uniref:SDR family NAD(P)-dependent oxidoreductase n=1 Tax=Prosthecomicrobium sp. N25 TaxID=3129254 RepID=UPI00307806BE
MSFDGLKIPDLAGRACLVTGASTGIGAAVARAFAAQGARVGVHYNASAEAASAIVADIRGAGGEAVAIHGDLGRTGEAARVVEAAAAQFGGLDILVNNAGALVKRVPIADSDEAIYDAVMDLNVRQVVAASRAAIPHIRARGGGSIINTSSIAARNGGGNGAVFYAAAKAFVSNLTRGLAKELVGSGIRVNAVAPGVITTPFHERYSTPEHMKAMVASVPMGRAGVPEDCVGAYLFLASPMLSSYVTGQVLEVNGGQLMP